MKSDTTFKIELASGETLPRLQGLWWKSGNEGGFSLASEGGVSRTEVESHSLGTLLLTGKAEEAFRTHPGSMVVVNPGTGAAILACHPSGMHPLYLRSTPHGVIAGNSLTEVAGPSREPDLAGILQHLSWGWTVGERTILHGVRRLDPGAVVRISVASGAPTMETTTIPWHRAGTAPTEGEPGFWDSLRMALPLPATGKVAVMMSGGWDSRTVLAALLQQVSADRILLYSHGNAKSRELSIVEEVGRAVGCTVHLETIPPQAFALPKLLEGFVRTENVIFPHWHHAGRRLVELGVTRAFTGVFGELVGGRYGTTTEGSFAQKVLATMFPRWTGREVSDRAVEEALRRFEGSLSKGRPWFLTQDAWAASQPRLDDIRAECHAWLDQERARDNSSLGGLMESFYLKHRAGQFAGAQPRSFLGNMEWASPMASLDCIRSAASLDFPSRVQNRTNRELLRQQRVDVLRPSTAACLVPASYPIPIQETSRAIRKIGQALNRYRRNPAAVPLSWNDFSFLRGAGAMEGLARTFRSDLIDQAAVEQRIEEANSSSTTNWHSLAEMMSKIANVEWSLNPGAIDTAPGMIDLG